MIYGNATLSEAIETGEIDVTPYDESNVGPASIDLTLGNEFVVYRDNWTDIIDTKEDDIQYVHDERRTTDTITVGQDEFVLGTTAEHVSLSDSAVGRITGRSSLGRLGIEIHKTAGFVDPGFSGQITLEITNANPTPVMLHAGDRVCQLVVEDAKGVTEPYSDDTGHYHNQHGVELSSMSFD